MGRRQDQRGKRDPCIRTDRARSRQRGTQTVEEGMLTNGAVSVVDLLVLARLAPSKGEAKRLIQQGGVFKGDGKVERFDAVVTEDELKAGVVIRKGKKVFEKFILA